MKFFSRFLNLKTSLKLIFAFILIACIQIGGGLFSVYNMGKLNENTENMYDESLQPIQYLNETRYLFQELKVNWRDIFISVSSKERIKLLDDVKAARDDINRNIELYSKTSLNKEQKELLERFESELEKYNREYDRSIDVIIENDTKYFNQMNLNKLQIELGIIINKLIEINVAEAEKENIDSGQTYTMVKNITLFNITLTFILCIVFGILISRVISKPLNQVVGLVEKVADGDLTETTDIQTKDEIGKLAQSVNRMVVNLRGMIQNILSAAENLSASSEQVSASTVEVASASANQANAAQTMNELFGELSDAIHSVAKNTEQAAKLSNETIRIAQDGEKVLLSSVEGAHVVSDQMGDLEQDSNRIGEIIEVIDDIADQTNLLALNAAIEAARAGEQGRGFAVVADEVRKLAERSGEATKQITSIIKEMQNNTALSVKSVQEGLVYTQKSGEAFEQIIKMVKETGKKVTEIAGASEQQAAQSSEVLHFIESISAATEEATASSEETASTAQSLTELAEELNASVANFKLGD
ncbi:methyl-accepting chemotaxis protein [Siminovitchia fortis]|uniref:Methyl-accepting chemotaxis protein n=1 Tax=Siminovitchia fortis TaxID=254758 RepID=A0A443IK31_9BACI|nr:methyl-accepting chemotaxis protein [Siminovitchia fortis]RWR04705.1 methyl-accepting chemotaxis protein [Siminovitchia fortis]WHY83514.1 methyl-accepting chemotaxis protein [Siminovitchia fortis]